MARELLRLRESLVNTPHLVHPMTFKTVIDYLDARNTDPSMIEDDDEDEVSNSRYSYNEDSKVALLNIDGPLTYRPVRMLCGGNSGTNYQTLKSDFLELAEAGAKTIALYVNSGGGMAYSMMPTARYMRQVADQYGIRILTMVDGMSASAAYGLSVVADEIILAEGASVGSVGVLIQLLDNSKALEKEGYKRVFISAGKNKIPLEEDGGFKADFLAGLQKDVDELYDQFTSFVAEHRKLTQQQVIDTNAEVFSGEEAIKLGLADKIMSVESFFDYLAEVAESNMKGDNKLFGNNKLFNKKSVAVVAQALTQEEVTENMKLEELQAQFTTVQTELVASKEAFTALTQAHEALAETFAEEKASLEAMVAEAKDQVASLEAEKVQTKLDRRQTELSKFVPAATAEELTATFASLDDTAFSIVLNSYAIKNKQEASADLFEELGEQGESQEEAVSTSQSQVDKIKQATLVHKQK